MRIPLLHRKPRDIATIAKGATYVGSAEVAGPRLQPRTREERERASALFRSWRNGSAPPR
jgi:hypothetical protein